MKVTSFAIIVLTSVAPAMGFNNYLSQMGGKQATVKPSSFAPSGKPGASGNSGTGGYLSNIAAPSPPPPARAPPAPPVAAAPPAAAAPRPAAAAPAGKAAPTAVDYLSSLRTQAAPSGGGVPGYLDALKTGGASAPSGRGVPGYLDALKTSASSAPSGRGVSGYLDAIAPSAGSSAKPSLVPSKPAFVPSSSSPATASGLIAQEPVLKAINQLNDNMVKNQEATISVLTDINNSVKALAAKTI